MCCVAGFGASLATLKAGGAGAQFLLPLDNAQKESRAKALLQSAHKVPVDSLWYFYGVAAIFRAAGFPPTDLDRNLRSARLLRRHAPFSG
jgi:hypothetical protein